MARQSTVALPLPVELLPSTLTVDEYFLLREQYNQHEIDLRDKAWRDRGQVWGGCIASVGILGSLGALFFGADAAAASIMTAEFVALIAVFVIGKKEP